MPMMTMLIICISVYFTLMVAILIYHKNMNPKITNMVFIVVNTILFVGYCINEYYRKGEFVSLTFDQISPFIFTTLPLSYLMNKKVKEAYFCSVAFLSFGMFVAMLVSPQHAYISSYRADATMLYVLDTLEHLNCSLFGIYLIVSKQVKLNSNNLIKSFIFMYSVIGLVLFMNFTFHKNYFGMGPYSDYGIYMFEFFDTYWMTLIVYLIGVALVLVLGYEFNYVLEILNANNEEKKSLTKSNEDLEQQKNIEDLQKT